MRPITPLFLCSLALITTGTLHAQPGTLDPTFGTGGKVSLQLDGQPTNGFAVAFTQDGKVVVAGQTGNPLKPFVMRFLPNGQPDTGFGTNGAVVLPLAANETGEFRSVLLDGMGRVLAAGSKGPTGIGGIGQRDALLARFTSTGALDNSFGTSGIAVTNLSNGIFGDVVNAIALDSQGRIVACGEANLDPDMSFFADLVVARFLASGALDNGFGNAGRFIASLGTIQTRGRALAIRPDGNILAGGGYTVSLGNESFVVMQLSSTGALATGWADNGMREVSWGSSFDRVASMALYGDGSLLLAGPATPSGPQGLGLAKLGPTGSLDPAFGQGGKRYMGSGTGHYYGGFVALQPDGHILLACSGENPGTVLDFQLFRRLPNSDPDPSFGTGGDMAVDISLTDGIGAMAIGPDGKALMVGTAGIGAQQQLAMARVITGIVADVQEYGMEPLRVFPVPSVIGTPVRIEGFIHPQSTILVRDLLGRVVELPVQRNAGGFALDVTALAPGRYFVELAQPSGRSTASFIKQ